MHHPPFFPFIGSVWVKVFLVVLPSVLLCVGICLCSLLFLYYQGISSFFFSLIFFFFFFFFTSVNLRLSSYSHLSWVRILRGHFLHALLLPSLSPCTDGYVDSIYFFFFFLNLILNPFVGFNWRGWLLVCVGFLLLF